MSAVGQANPFSDASEYNMLAFVIERATDEMQTVSIGEVIAVNTGAQTVDVQILVNLVTGANTPVDHEVIANRPYFRLQGGGNAIICDPVVGDIGIVVFASRDITGVVAAKGAANPSSNRKFSWSDGIYLGGILNGTPTQYMQFLASGGGINIVSPGTVAIQAPATTVSGTATVQGNTTLNATLTVASTSMLSGAVTAPAGITTTTIAGTSAVFSGSVTASSFIGGGGGGGSVTSVGTGTGLTGGPITTSGTISLSSTTIAALALATTALQPNGISGSFTNANITVSGGQITAASSGTSGSLTVTDGTHTVTGVTDISVSGATVSGTTPNAVITISGASVAVPGTIPDLVGWWESDDILGSTGYQVTKLRDRTPWISGTFATTSNTAATGSATVDATLLNGLPVLKWPAGTSVGEYDLFSGTVQGMSFANGCTMFIVIKGSTTAGTQTILGCGNNAGLSLFLTSASTGVGVLSLVNSGVALIGACTASWTPGTAFQANVTYSNSTGAWAFRQSQTAAGSGTGTTGVGTTVSTSKIANDQSFGAYLNAASIAAIICYNRILSSGEITSVENYLNAKWNV